MQATWNKKDKLYEDEQKEETAPSICQQPTIRKNGMNWSYPINTRSAHNSLHSATRQLRGIGFITLFCRQHWGSVFYSFYVEVCECGEQFRVSACLWSMLSLRAKFWKRLVGVKQWLPCLQWVEKVPAVFGGCKQSGCALSIFIHLYPSLSIFILYISFHPVCLVTFEGSVGEPSIRETLGLTFLPWRSLEPWSFFFLMYFWGKLWQMDFGLMNSSMFWRKPTYVYI